MSIVVLIFLVIDVFLFVLVFFYPAGRDADHVRMFSPRHNHYRYVGVVYLPSGSVLLPPPMSAPEVGSSVGLGRVTAASPSGVCVDLLPEVRRAREP